MLIKGNDPFTVKFWDTASGEIFLENQMDFAEGKFVIQVDDLWRISDVGDLELAAYLEKSNQNRLYAPLMANQLSDPAPDTLGIHTAMQVFRHRGYLGGGVLVGFMWPFETSSDPQVDMPGDQIGAYRMLPPPESAGYVYLPAVGAFGDEVDAADNVVRVMNVDDEDVIVHGIFWTSPGPCPPDSQGPFYNVASATLAPQEVYDFIGPGSPTTIPATAFSALFFAVDPDFQIGGMDLAAWIAANWRGDYSNPPVIPSESLKKLLLISWRKVQTQVMDAPIIDCQEGHQVPTLDPDSGSYQYFCPGVYDGMDDKDTILYIQNTSQHECASVTIESQRQGEMIRQQVATIPALAPGESYITLVGDLNIGPLWQGLIVLTSNLPLAVTFDNWTHDVLLTGKGLSVDEDAGNKFLIPLIGNSRSGFNTQVFVYSIDAQQVMVSFVKDGSVVATLCDSVPPSGQQEFPLAVVAAESYGLGDQYDYALVEFFDSDGQTPKTGFASSEVIRWDGPAQANLTYGHRVEAIPITVQS